MCFDREHRHLFTSDAVEEQTGIPSTEFFGKTHRELGFPEPLCELWEDAIDQVFRTSEPHRIEFELPTGIWIDWQLVPQIRGDGKAEMVITGARDITGRKEAELELARTEALLEAAIDATPVGVLIADAPDVNIRVANRAGLLIRGESEVPLTEIPDELHPRRWRAFRPDGRPFAFEDLPLSRAVLKGERVENEVVVIRRPDGEERWVLASASPIRNKQGELIGGVVVFPDITEIQRDEERRLRFGEALRRTD